MDKNYLSIVRHSFFVPIFLFFSTASFLTKYPLIKKVLFDCTHDGFGTRIARFLSKLPAIVALFF